MNVSLTPELERLVTEKVRSGLYQTASEVVREALRLLKERDDRLERLRQDVGAGIDGVAVGDYKDYDDRSIRQLGAEVKAAGRKRLTRRPERIRR